MIHLLLSVVCWLPLCCHSHPSATPLPLPPPSLVNTSDPPELTGVTSRPATPPVFASNPFVVDPFSPQLAQRNPECRKSVTPESCVSVPNVTCFGTPLPYDTVSFELTGLERIWQAQSKLKEWTRLQNVPKCWAVIQPLLCSVYLPKCRDSQVDRIGHHLCRVTRGPCRIVEQWEGWPEFLRCNNTEVFRKGCGEDEFRRPGEILRFKKLEAKCPTGLVATDKKSSFYKAYDGCGLACSHSSFSREDAGFLRTLLGYISGFGFVVFLLVVATHFAPAFGKRHLFPEVIILYMSICSMGIMLALMLPQFSGDVRESVVCDRDGTRRLQATGQGYHYCTVSFFLVYFSFISFLIWFVILSYCWYARFVGRNVSSAEHRAAGGPSSTLGDKTVYFHMAAWAIPFVLTMTLISLNLVEGDYLSGVCFVSDVKPVYRGLTVLLPLLLTVGISAFYIFNTLRSLKAALGTNNADKTKTSLTVTKSMLRICVSTGLLYLCSLYTVGYAIYSFLNQDLWEKSLEDRIHCLTKKTVAEEESYVHECSLKQGPSYTLISIQILCLVFASIAVLVWMLPGEIYRIWKQTISGWMNRNSADETDKKKVRKYKKHELIQQVYAQRPQLQQQGRLSLSLDGLSVNRNRAVDMNFVQDTSSGGELSTTFAGAIPRLVQRRGALANIDQYDVETGLAKYRRGSLESRSISIRSSNRLSVIGLGDNRKRSFDSQLSIQPNELEYLRNLYEHSIQKKGKKRSKRNFFGTMGKSKRDRRHRRLSMASRNDSFTSNELSTTGGTNTPSSQVLPAITLDPSNLSDVSSSNLSLRLPKGSDGNTFEMKSIKPKKSSGFSELLERLGQITSASTETTANDPAGAGTASPGVACTSSSLRPINHHASVQTSMTDLSMVGGTQTQDNSPQGKVSIGTQYEKPSKLLRNNFPESTTTTTSSSQTESHPLQPLEPNVVRISVPHQSSEDSSIPSSYDPPPRSSGKQQQPLSTLLNVGIGGGGDSAIRRNAFKENLASSSGPLIHNRARRGGLIDHGCELELAQESPLPNQGKSILVLDTSTTS